MEDDLKKAKKLAEKLTPDELAKLATHIATLSHFTRTASAPESATERNVDRVLSILVDFGRAEGLEHASVHMLRTGRDFPSFASKVDELDAYVAKASGGTRTQEVAFWNLAFKLLADDMRQMQIGVTVRTIMRTVHRVPAIMHKSFPGYAATGMLATLLFDEHRKNNGRRA